MSDKYDSLEKLVYTLHHDEEYEELINLVVTFMDEDLPYSVWLGLAIAYIRTFDFNNAMEVLMKIKDEGENDIIWHAQVALIYSERSEYEKEIYHLRRAEELGIDDPWVFVEMAMTLGELGDNKEKMRYLKKVEPLMDKNPWLSFEMGICLLLEKKEKEGLKFLKKAEKNGLKEAWLFIHIGMCLSVLEKKDEAISYFLKAQKVMNHPSEIQAVYTQLGFTYTEMGMYREGLKYLTKAKDCGVKLDEVNYLLAVCMAMLDETDNKNLTYYN